MEINIAIQKAIIAAKISDQNILLAVSGGADSQVLLKSFPHVAKEFNIKCFAVGINHGLREDADKELDLAESLASKIGVPFLRKKIKVERKGSLQEDARNARYAALNDVCGVVRSKYIVTAHHYDDRAETVLMRLLRGKNIGSLAVLPLISGNIFRPMLSVTKEDIKGYCKRWKLDYANDPSNEDTDFMRVKIRKEILPMLESLNPKFKIRLNDLADEALNLNS